MVCCPFFLLLLLPSLSLAYFKRRPSPSKNNDGLLLLLEEEGRRNSYVRVCFKKMQLTTARFPEKKEKERSLLKRTIIPPRHLPFSKRSFFLGYFYSVQIEGFLFLLKAFLGQFFFLLLALSRISVCLR